MKTFIVALLLGLLPMFSGAQTVRSLDDLAAYVNSQTRKLNENTASVKTLTAQVTALQAELTTTKNKLEQTQTEHNKLLKYLLRQACFTNAKMAPITAVFSFMKPFPIGNHTCPPETDPLEIPILLTIN